MAKGMPMDFESKSASKKRKRKGGNGKWIQRANAQMEAKGTKGSFTRAAKRAGKSIAQEAASVLKKGSKASTTMKRRAVFAQNMRKIAARKKKGK